MKEIENLAAPGTYTILTGKLPEPHNPKTQTIEGNFQAPSEFWEKRTQEDLYKKVFPITCVLNIDEHESNTHLNHYPSVNYHPSVCRVEFDTTKESITLTVDEATDRQITVTGTLRLNPMLGKLKINNPDEGYSTFDELYRAIKFNRAVFKSKERHAVLLKDLKNFKQKVVLSIEAKDDTKGNIKKKLDISSTETPELDFDLHMPIFVGGTNQDIELTVEVVFRNSSPEYYLTSIELSELIHLAKEKAFETEKTKFQGLPIIYK